MTMNRQQQILVVDDEPMVREVVTAYLERDGFGVHTEIDGAKALEYLATASPDLVVLDIMLPHVDGLQILAKLRAVSDVPVILLTARTEEPDRVMGLELGADDYVTKPFSPRELAARVRSVLRRAVPENAPRRLEFTDLVIDEESRDVVVRGEGVDLTPKEFELLAHLAASPKKVFTRGELLEDVWASSPDYQDPSTVTVHIRRLRRKIEIDAESPRWLTTVWGVGYRFEP
ncbi:MAG: response regulator transcription factor [Actinobacteria bacterium]|nr:response regulator transcription factor [Actinomycetota bacterium]